ncbi:MAG: helix-turn-helix transcriptional regulator [Deltaproteobacteria bacterium]|nr:helix-turn-helix transcriptional regulator [Deltaproteobacteria bacterium]
MSSVDPGCEAFKPGDGQRPKVLTLAEFPASAIETCRPVDEPPDHPISVNQFLVSLDSQAKAKAPTKPEGARTDGMTVKQAAKRLGIQAQTLNYHIGKDRLTVTQTEHGPVIDPADLDAFVKRWRRNRRQHVFESTAQGFL